MGGSSGELQELTKRLIDGATTYGMEVSIEKCKIMTNSMNNIHADISMNHQKLEEVVVVVVVAFFLACKDFWRMFNNSFPACAFFFF